MSVDGVLAYLFSVVVLVADVLEEGKLPGPSRLVLRNSLLVDLDILLESLPI